MSVMYIDESYDMPGETLIRAETHDLRTVEDGVILAQLLYIALNQTFQVFVDLSAVQQPSQEALVIACEALRRILPPAEIRVRLWFYCNFDLIPLLPDVKYTRQKPRSFSLEKNFAVSPIYVY